MCVCVVLHQEETAKKAAVVPEYEWLFITIIIIHDIMIVTQTKLY